MPLRLVEVTLPGDARIIEDLSEELPVVGFTREQIEGEGTLVRLIIPSEHAEQLLDTMEKRYGSDDAFRIVMLDVIATIPRWETEEREQAAEEADEETGGIRLHREELYESMQRALEFSWVNLALIALSAVVAAVGMNADNSAAVIGAMMIAPLVGPSMALSLATTLGDLQLGFRAVRTNAVGFITAFAIAALTGFLVGADTDSAQLSLRLGAGLGEVTLALAAGGAGALAYTIGMSATLIGVMVAVALLPPLVAVGLLTGAGKFALAGGAALLFLGNFICINLSGVASFLVMSVRPTSWWEEQRAKRATFTAIVIWSLMLAGIVSIILFLTPGGSP